MTPYLQRTISVTLLALTLASFGTPVVQGLASTPTVSTTQGPSTPSQRPTTGDHLPGNVLTPTMPAAGEPGARLPLPDLKAKKNNTRDLGGYRTADDRWQIATNRLIRSGKLSKFSRNDVQVLRAHQLAKIVDFRTPAKIAEKPDVTIPGVTWQNISIYGPSATGLTNDQDGQHYEGQLETSPAAIAGYRQFLNGLLDQPGATLYHCSHGKDRTGIATVLVMTILGMRQDDIIKDYLLSTTYGWKDGQTVKYAWLKRYFQLIDQHYGSLQNYIQTQLQFSPAKQEQLRAQYLVSTTDGQTPYRTPQPVKPAKPTLHHPQPIRYGIQAIKRFFSREYGYLKQHCSFYFDRQLHKHRVTTPVKGKWRVVKHATMTIGGHTEQVVQVRNAQNDYRWVRRGDVKLVK